MKYIDLKSIRREYNISQSELAKRIGKPQAYVSSIENHKKYATEEFISKVAEVLKIKNIDSYLIETPRKVIIRNNEDNVPPLDINNIPSDDTDCKAMIASLIKIIERCHESMREKDQEIARLRSSLGEKYQEIANMLAKKKEEKI